MTAHEIALRVARAAPGAPSRSPPTTACPRPSTCPTGDARTTSPAPTSSPGSWAASASPCSGTAARASRCSTIGTKTGRADKRGEAAAAPPPAVVKPRPHSLTGRTYRDRDADRHRVHHRQRARRRRALRGLRPGRQGRLRHDGGRRGAGPADLAHAEACRRRCRLSGGSKRLISQLSRIGGAQPLGFGAAAGPLAPGRVSRASWPSTSARPRSEEVEPPAGPTAKRVAGDLCKECGQATFVYEEGCKKCLRAAASTSAEPRRLSIRPRPPRPWQDQGAWRPPADHGSITNESRTSPPTITRPASGSRASSARTPSARARASRRWSRPPGPARAVRTASGCASVSASRPHRVAPDRARLPRGRRGAPALRLVRGAGRAGSGRGPRAPRHRPIRRLRGPSARPRRAGDPSWARRG